MSEQGGNVSTDVLQEIVAVAGDPSLTLDDLGQRMNLLYQLAEQREDKESVALVTTVWDGVVKLSEQAGHAINIATAAREIAKTLQEQRDVAIRAHEELVEAINDHDIGNPLINDLMDDMREVVQEDMWDDGIYISYSPAYDILEAEIPVSYTVADAFHDILTGGRYDDVSEEIKQEIADFMVMIVHKVDGEDAGDE